MSSISNEGFLIYIKFFLSLTLHYSVGFSQILIQILMKKLGIRISGSSSLSAVETSIKPLTFHPCLWITSRVSYKVVLSRGWGLFAEFKSYSENLANIKKDCP